MLKKPGKSPPNKQKNATTTTKKVALERVKRTLAYHMSYNKKAECHFVQPQLETYCATQIFHLSAHIREWLWEVHKYRFWGYKYIFASRWICKYRIHKQWGWTELVREGSNNGQSDQDRGSGQSKTRLPILKPPFTQQDTVEFAPLPGHSCLPPGHRLGRQPKPQRLSGFSVW